jgi:Creatinase/Prolidase N-terminal domain
MKNTALLTGPYDWDPALLPLSDFESRLVKVRRVLAEQQVAALVVHGNSLEYGALAWLTGFVPKLGPAFAVIKKDGPIRLLVSGSPAMLPAAKRLTWLHDVKSIGNLQNTLTDWLSELPSTDAATVGLWGEDLMTLRANIAVQGAIQPFGRILELKQQLQVLQMEKSPREWELLRRACAILAISHKNFLHAVSQGCGARSASLAAERSAFETGAQDVRILASARNGGAPVALDGPSDPIINPLIACIAVRFAGYWVEGFVTCGTNCGSFAQAEAALSAMLRRTRAGESIQNLRSIGLRSVSPHRPHPFITGHEVKDIGLTLNEGYGNELHVESALRAGGVYTIRAGAAGEGSDNAIVSAMIAVDEQDTEILWPPIAALGKVSLTRECL